MPITRFDVAVVGAGPAGASAAWCLARRGASVALVDASHPREKPCGGGLTARALAGLRPMVRPEDLPGVLVRTMSFESGRVGAPARTSFALDSPGESRREPDAPLMVVSRLVLDRAMTAAATVAGARLLPERVRDIEIDASGARLRTTAGEYGADLVLGADGATSLVRRRLAVPFTRAQLSAATGYYVRGVSSTEVVIHCFGDPPGYLWSFPRPDHLAVGVCVPGDRVSGTESLRAVMVDLVAGRQSYRSLRRRLLGTLEAGLAWRLLRLHLLGLVYGG